MYLQLLAEFLGTLLFTLSFFITGSAIVIGVTMALVIFLLGSTSGAHVNPAVSLAFWLKGALTNSELVGYMTAQLLGGAAALYTYRTFL